MRHGRVWMAAGILLAAGHAGCAGQIGRDYPVRPVPFTEVRVTDAFWAPRMETNRKVSIPYAFKKCEETGRIDNFAVAGRLKEGKFQGIYFNDSDVYKVIEGAAYALSLAPDPALDKYVDDVIAKIVAAQQPDGYLYTARTLQSAEYKPPGGTERWSDIAGGHELYCVGHLYEAAAAHFQATGKRTLLDVAIKSADLVCSVFGPGRKTNPPGHEEIEIGLGKLYRVTGDAKYLAMAKFFLDTRGREDGRRLYGLYSQDHKPVLEQDEAVGHAVRAGYLYAGMADIAALTGDAAYVKAIDRIWENVVSKKLYVTGGIGARGGGEAFGENYELPNRSAYCETCAAIANALWNYRMFLLHADARYLDVVERVIYNGFLSGVAMEGDKFFYPNPLESHSGGARSPWFGCACCPSNVVRFVPSIPGYVYAHSGDVLYVNLFIGGSAAVKMDRRTVRLTQETRYPWDGAVRMTIEPDEPGEFTLAVRIPGWAENRPVPSDLYRYADVSDAKATLTVNGKAAALDLQKGFARVRRRWQKGDTVELVLPMPVRRVLAHEKVADDAGRMALERGPIVFCAEGHDNPDGRVLNVMVADDAPLRSEFRKDLLGGVEVVRTKAVSVGRREDGTSVAGAEQELVAIPCYAWAHRGPAPMAVWLARDLAAAKPLPGPTIAHTSKVTVSHGGDVRALTDQLEPRSSIDHSNPFFHWWPRKGTEEWVQYDFKEPTAVSSVDVYWFDDTGIGECRLPASWRLKAKVDGQWRDVPNPSGYGVEKDKYNRTSFDPVKAEGLRLEVQLPEKFSAGIHEWRVNAAAAGAKPAGTPAPKEKAADPAAAKEKPAANLLPNESFEQQEGGRPAPWRTDVWRGKGTFEHASAGRTGGRSVGIVSQEGADVSWACTVPVEPYATYRLSGWIKTDGVAAGTGRGALLNVHNIQPTATAAVTGTRDWTRVEVVFETRGEDAVQINCLLGGWGLSTGKAWYDDLRLEQVGEAKDVKPHIAIDAAKTGEPISKYIYGQFIEHLGRCIYGGIWAEMLEDRKFWYPVTAKYDPYGEGRRPAKNNPLPVVKASPWQVLGADDSVRMVKEGSFVGEQTPLVAPAGGIRQNDLGLVKGKEYVGYVWLKTQGGGTTVEVTLRWGEGPAAAKTVPIANVAEEYQQYPFKFTAGADTTTGALEVRVAKGAACLVGTVSLMPADNVQGMRRDTLALLKELDSPVYRWPGGNFVSGYDWKDGIGPRDRRPPRKNPAWTGVEHNDFGLDEFMTFCRTLGTEPYIAVNSGLGDAKNAVEELQYTNAPADTPMGQLRARNGHPEPYKVRFWGIGNEMYGGWQLGHMPLEKYTQKHNDFAQALRAVDPSVQRVAVGDAGPWSEGMMKNCADHMDLISEHFYCGEKPGLASHVRQIPDAVRRKAEAHRRYRRDFESLKGKDIRIALDEWNFWYGPHVFGELGTRYFLKDALGIAAGLNEYARQSDLFFMANYAQTVNVIGCIKTTKTAAAFDPTGLALALYRRHFGVLPVATETSPLLDAQAAWTADRKTLTVAVVNPTAKALDIPLTISGAKLSGQGTRWQIAGDDPQAYNEPGEPPRVVIDEAAVKGVSDKLSVAPCSVTLFALKVE